MLPLINQSEYHLYFNNKEIADYCIQNKIAFGVIKI
jgi:diketogulonate reductase-like aldo/keto reductase